MTKIQYSTALYLEIRPIRLINGKLDHLVIQKEEKHYRSKHKSKYKWVKVRQDCICSFEATKDIGNVSSLLKLLI